MVGSRTSETKETFYICGQCGFEQYAVIGEEPPVPCVDCAWPHRELKKYELPTDIKMDLTNYG